MRIELKLGNFQDKAQAAFEDLQQNKVMARIWDHDHTVWATSPAEISNRLGWLRIADQMKPEVDRIQRLVSQVQAAGYTNVLLLGMGGSSLAPEVLRETFGAADGYLDLAILDSTDPGAVLAFDKALDLTKTLFIVATKSGGTAETLSAFKYFYNRLIDLVGPDKVGEHFIGITDPGSKLETMGDEYQFRATFLNDPNIGGRYSALSFFGLIPAALVGIDLPKLLDRASTMALNCSADNCPATGDNAGGRLGAVIGELAKAGRDKLTLVLSPAVEHFGDWVEQLVAESTGKNGKGILPVVGEPIGSPDVYGDDRLFVYIGVQGDTTYDKAVETLNAAGHPLVVIELNDLYDLGGQFFLWEMATAVAGYVLEIHPFDQPNVESAKIQSVKMIEAYQSEGKLPELPPTLKVGGMTFYGDVPQSATAPDALKAFLAQAKAGDYISLQAYIPSTEGNSVALKSLQTALRDTCKLPVTVGYGPRFLHSTGQLHKGDAGNGLFIQFTADMPHDVDIPDEAGNKASSMSFGTLKLAQALGDRQALLDEKRRVLRVDLGMDAQASIEALAGAFR